MRNIKIYLFAAYTLIIILVTGYVCYKIFHTETPPDHITQDPIQYNVINNDINKLTIEQLRSELACYYKSEPTLGIKYESGDAYLLTAGLCARNWSRTVHINKPFRNNLLKVRSSVFYSKDGWKIGAGPDYTYFLTEWFCIGGGTVLYTDLSFSLDISLGLAW